MTKDTAAQIMSGMLVCIQELNNSIYLVQERCTPEELTAYKRGVGHTLSELHDRILDPILSSSFALPTL
jgi:hypothetical protein